MVTKANDVQSPHVSGVQISTLHHLSPRVAVFPPLCNEMNHRNSEQPGLLHNPKHFSEEVRRGDGEACAPKPAVTARKRRCEWERMFDRDNWKAAQASQLLKSPPGEHIVLFCFFEQSLAEIGA